jgi:hypothetical protein
MELQARTTKEPFSHQAAKFSAYAPFVLFLFGIGFRVLVKDQEGASVSLILGGVSALTTLVAYVLGFVGLVGGIQRRAAKTIIFAIVGITFNSGLVALWAGVIIGFAGRN